MKRKFILLILSNLSFILYGQIIDHKCTSLQNIPDIWIDRAKSALHVAYEHTSHGSQLIDGMTGLYNWKGSVYAFNKGGSVGALDISDYAITGGSDLGNPDFTSWASSTRIYLDKASNSNINVIIWAWCGQLSNASTGNVNTYLSLMSSLETDYPAVRFVYMTGHVDGSGINGNLNLCNEQIRAYCKNNNKILYDFADIESYDPDGVYYGDKYPTEACNYDFNNDGVSSQEGDPATPTNGDKNWALDWQKTHNVNIDWYNCGAAHSQTLNANRKAYAAWWLWARLAGWNGGSTEIPVTGITVTGAGSAPAITSNNGSLQVSAVLLPSNATYKTVTWSIINGTGQAIINNTGLVTAVAFGTVTARATANDASGVYGALDINISLATGITATGENQPMKIFATSYEMRISLSENFFSWRADLYNLQGCLVFSKQIESDIIIFDVSSLPAGIYVAVLSSREKYKIAKVFKP